ncbi:hypothetical protein [Frankia nepalensis]|uniref:Uncharacterized protein n=1 Tax=Frankia nepalensis TaxID=1836974 RepID=A0A937URJ4_9ACTN|nr:hypothetical protein [Frankia nepalensis]MBL7498886.1 hypothetical protein [Frankia nepalensis]MBL7512561.1 hypothetical protein [Frankia nepalensis]MBL7632924.1 hypothetical protein [Frankia nepalensis]
MDELVAAPGGGQPAAFPDDEPAGGRIRVDHLVTSGGFTPDGGLNRAEHQPNRRPAVGGRPTGWVSWEE